MLNFDRELVEAQEIDLHIQASNRSAKVSDSDWIRWEKSQICLEKNYPITIIRSNVSFLEVVFKDEEEYLAFVMKFNS